MNFFKNHYLIIIIIVIGSILRLWGINFGLPFQFHQDEPIVVNHALAYGTGDLNPHFFNIPPLVSYILFLLYAVYFLIGKTFGVFGGSEDFAISFFKDPSAFYIIGRITLGVIPGIFCIFLIYILAKDIFSKRTALFSALIMAVCYLNVINSHYIYVDMLMVLFILSAYICFFKLFKTPSLKMYILSAIFLGLAIGAKYNAALLGLTFFLTHIFIVIKEKGTYSKIIFSKRLWLSFFTTFFVFIFTNPFSVLVFREFYTSFSKQAAAAWVMGWSHHFVYSLKEGISLPVLLLGIIGLIIMAFKEKEKGIVLISFPAIFYIILVYYSQPFSRYVLPLTPFLAMGLAYFLFEVIWGYCTVRLLRMVLIFVSIILILPTTIKTVKADILFSSEDTRILCADWIKKHIPLGLKIACDSTFFKPALKQPYSQLKEKQDLVAKQPEMAKLKEKKLDYMLKVSDKGYKGYLIYFLSEEAPSQGQFLNTTPSIDFNIDSLRKNGIDYVIINHTVTSKMKEFFLDDVKNNLALIKAFSPYYDGKIRPPYDKFATTCMPIDTTEVFLRRYAGPSIEIYKLKR